MDAGSHFSGLLVNFSPIFNEPSFRSFITLVTGWVVCGGRRTISRVIQHGSILGEAKQHAAFYRFFSRATWNPDELGRCIFRLVLPLLPEDWGIVLLVDDTLCRKGGAHIWGGGMHHDPLLSSYGRGRTAVKLFSFGHSWVILSLCIPLPWNRQRGIALPIGFRLYRSKKQCPFAQYRKRTELARELVDLAAAWVPGHRPIHLVGDAEYACREVVRGLPDRIVFVGPIHMDAALYDPPSSSEGPGRPRRKGKRLPSPRKLLHDARVPWTSRSLRLYGRKVKVLVKTQVGLWYHVAGDRLVRMIVTRDPRGRIVDRAYFMTDAQADVEAIAHLFSLRWTQEEMHHNVKQNLGLEDPQNGWWRRPKGRRRVKQVAGPQPHKQRGSHAVERTVPFILTVYAIVVLWYLEHGNAQEDVKLARRLAPWYRHKTEPSFGDLSLIHISEPTRPY